MDSVRAYLEHGSGDPMLKVNEIYNQDCNEGMEQIDDETVDLIVTSPPYNLDIKYDTHIDNMPLPEYWKWCERWLTHCFRVLKPDGRLCLNHYLSCGTSEQRFAPLMKLNCIAEDIGFKHHGVAIWDDRTLTKRTAWGSWRSASAPYCNSPFEGILIMFKDHWKKDRQGITNISKKEFMEISTGIWKIQPCQKYLTIANFPVELPQKCIRFFSYEEDLVLDPFMGSGRTGVAAKRNNRNYIGFEISPAYCEVARQELSQSTMDSWNSVPAAASVVDLSMYEHQANMHAGGF